MSSAVNLLASSNYIVLNRSLARRFGLDGAAILGEIASEHKYYYDRDELEDGWFYSTVENLEKNTTCTKYQQSKALNAFVEAGIIGVDRRGVPPKRYIRLNEDALGTLLDELEEEERQAVLLSKVKNLDLQKSKNLTFESEKTSPLKVKKLDTKNNNTNNNKLNSNKKSNKDKESAVAVTNEPPKKGLKVVYFPYDEALEEAFQDFIKMRKEIKAPMTERAKELTIKKLQNLSNGDPDIMIQILNQSIERSWRGVFALQTSYSQRQGYNNQIRGKSIDELLVEEMNG